MHWNHRVIEFINDHDGSKYYGIHEVYYDEQNAPRAYTENAVGVVWGEDEPDAAMLTIERMAAALQRPPLKASEFPKPEPLDWGATVAADEGEDLGYDPEQVEQFEARERSKP